MKNKTSGIFATIFFTLISILFVSPILIVLMNSFKKKAFISLEPFKLPNEKSYVGLENYLTSISKYDFIKAVGWTVFITVLSVIVILVCCSMCMVHYPRTKQDYKINLPFMRIFHGNSFPDGYVHFIRNC